MKVFVRNNAIYLTPDAYPPNLAAAFRIASGSANEWRELNGESLGIRDRYRTRDQNPTLKRRETPN